MLRRFTPLVVAIVMSAIAAMPAIVLAGGARPDQVKSAHCTCVPSRSIAWYTANFDSVFSRSKHPINLAQGGNKLSETASPDGIDLSLNSASGVYMDAGVVTEIVKLSYLTSHLPMSITGSGPIAANLWVDTNGDGTFFTWANDIYQGYGSDDYGALGTAKNGKLAVAPTTPVQFFTHGHGSVTLADLAAGKVAGIDGTTVVALWIGIDVAGPPGSKVEGTASTINGAPLSQCTVESPSPTTSPSPSTSPASSPSPTGSQGTSTGSSGSTSSSQNSGSLTTPGLPDTGFAHT